jgi:hypothetical protein
LIFYGNSDKLESAIVDSNFISLYPQEFMDCQCAICKRACERKPGWFAPGELTKAAQLLGMNEKEFFDAKPLECKQYDHTMKREEAIKRRHEIVEIWRQKQQEIELLLGRKPCRNQPNIIDLFEFLSSITGAEK